MRHGHSWLIGSLVAVALAALVLIAPGKEGALAQGDTIYVDADAEGGNNGDSWTDAFTDLQLALDRAEKEDQIWVAAGTYKPTAEHGGSGDRYKSFQMVNGVALYGGFLTDTGKLHLRGQLRQRRWRNDQLCFLADADQLHPVGRYA